jgi:hypothetical protein
MNTSQLDETDNDPDLSRLVNTLATLDENFRKTGCHRFSNCYHSNGGEYTMAITVGVQSLRHMGFSARMRARCRRHASVNDPSEIAAGTTAVLQNRCPEQPPHTRAVCHSFGWAGLTECRRDYLSDARSFEANDSHNTETLGESSRLVCKTGPTAQASGSHRPGKFLSGKC